MNKLILTTLAGALLLTSCVSKKNHAKLQASNATLLQDIGDLRNELSKCNADKGVTDARIAGLESGNQQLKDQVRDLNNTNAALMNNVGNLATLSAKESANMEKSLESMREKDMQIKTMQDALTKKDSVTLALVTSLKGVLGNMDDKDIQINVDKGVVFINISENLLFGSGSYVVSSNATAVLEKVAKVVNNKPDMDVLVESHTDNVPIAKQCIADNWDLSVMRATAIVKVLQNNFAVAPARMTAGGRSEYMPLVANDTPEHRAANRRTRIVILPKIDQFYNMIEEGMKEATGGKK
jgi:chemotaxis protein MotB